VQLKIEAKLENAGDMYLACAVALSHARSAAKRRERYENYSNLSHRYNT
jgi:hypothetical protein